MDNYLQRREWLDFFPFFFISLLGVPLGILLAIGLQMGASKIPLGPFSPLLRVVGALITGGFLFAFNVGLRESTRSAPAHAGAVSGAIIGLALLALGYYAS